MGNQWDKKGRSDGGSYDLRYDGDVRTKCVQVYRAREPAIVVHTTLREYAAE